MSTQSLGVRSVDATTGAAAAELFTSAGQTVRVMEISISLVAATASIYGIGRPAAKGITPTTPVLLRTHDSPANAATASVAMAWGTGPTVPAAFMYRVAFAAGIGQYAVLRFPEGIIVPISSSLVVWNLASNSLADINFTVTTSSIAGVFSSF